MLPADLRDDLDATALMVGPVAGAAEESADLGLIRQAIRTQRKLDIAYADGQGAGSRRVVWPFALGFFDKVRIMIAWCETRQDFRHFRADRLSALTVLDQRYPRRRQAMLKEWRASQNIPS